MSDLGSDTLIVNYHYCSDESVSTPAGLTGVTSKQFGKQMGLLLEAFEENGEINKKDQKNKFLITFDDGVRGVIDNAFPVIKDMNVPAIFFCCAAPLADGRVLNVQKTHLLSGAWGWSEFEKKFMYLLTNETEKYKRDDIEARQLAEMYRYDNVKTGKFKRLLNVDLPYSLVDSILDKLFESVFGPQQELIPHLYMSRDEIKRCAESHVGIGIHTYSHRMLSRLTPKEKVTEIRDCLNFFRRDLGIDSDSISYPYGITGSWDSETKTECDKCSIKFGYTLEREFFKDDSDCDLLEIPRFDVNDVFGEDGLKMNRISNEAL